MNPEDILAKMLKEERYPHALLFVGARGPKEDAAYAFAGNLICLHGQNQHRGKIASKNHPDIHLYYPEGKTGMHAIQTLRHLTQEVVMCPNEAQTKVFILHDAERMLPSSANALLKTLEEPASRTVLILLSSLPDKILPTIRSRCQTICFSKEKLQNAPSAPLLDILSGKSPPKAIEAILTDLEEEKKTWEKELFAELPPDLGAQQKGVYEKEIEGALALRFQERLFSFLETILEWYRDSEAVKLGLSNAYLFFPDRRDDLKKSLSIPLERVENYLADARLALERLMRPQQCFEVLLMRLL